MKKALIVLLALGGMAFATDFTADTASGILYRNSDGDFTTFGGVTYNATTHTLTFNDVFAVSEEANRIQYTLGVLIDMSKINASTLGTGTKLVTTGTGTTMGIGMTSERKYATVWGNDVPWSGATTDAITAEGPVTLVHSTSGAGSTHMIEGQKFNDANIPWSWSTLKGSQAGLNSFVLNADYEDAILAVGVWQAATTYNGNTTVGVELAQISDTLKTIPEPATATLSLLALAGLAARRRRH